MTHEIVINGTLTRNVEVNEITHGEGDHFGNIEIQNCQNTLYISQ